MAIIGEDGPRSNFAVETVISGHVCGQQIKLSFTGEWMKVGGREVTATRLKVR